MGTPEPKLYVLSGSHPCAAVEAAMERKGIAYRRVELLPLGQLVIGPLRYGGITVPGMRIGDERIVGSRAIMRRLDELAPEPPLLPAPGERTYAQVLEAERWGDEVFQPVARRVLDVAFLRDTASMESFASGPALMLPPRMLRAALPLTARLLALRNRAREETARADLLALPAQLERIDRWIGEGLLGGEQPNAADLQIGSTLRLLMSIEDVRPLIDAHPAARLGEYFGPMQGRVPAGALPADWVKAPAQA
jgi:glutathione S-transferase